MRHPDITSVLYAALAAMIAVAAGCSDSTGADGSGLRVVVDPPQAEVSVGATAQLQATVRNGSGTVVTNPRPSWTSTDTSVATVSDAGVVTGRKLGVTRIFASVPGYDADATIHVVAPAIASVSVSPASASMAVGDMQQLTATVKDGTGATRTDRAVVWTSENEVVAGVSPFTGVVTARAAGTARIVATVDGKTGSATVTVGATPSTPPPPTTPTPSLTANFGFACTNLICTFTDASSATSGAVVGWAWSFGDGQTSPHRNSDVTYQSAGNYTVTLTVTDDKGGTSSVTKTVSPTASTARVRLVNRLSGKCMSVAGGSAERGMRLVERACDGGQDQLFALPTGAGAGPLQLVALNNRYVELDVASPSGEVESWTWHGGMQQRWNYTATGQLRSYLTNTCIRAPGGTQPLVLALCAGEADQQWDVRP